MTRKMTCQHMSNACVSKYRFDCIFCGKQLLLFRLLESGRSVSNLSIKTVLGAVSRVFIIFQASFIFRLSQCWFPSTTKCATTTTRLWIQIQWCFWMASNWNDDSWTSIRCSRRTYCYSLLLGRFTIEKDENWIRKVLMFEQLSDWSSVSANEIVENFSKPFSVEPSTAYKYLINR